MTFPRPPRSNASAGWWHRRFQHRVTALGAAYLAALTVVALIAFASGNNLLFLILAAMVSALVLSGFIGRLTLAGLELDLVLPAHTSARRPVQAKIVVRNLKGWMPSYSVHVAFSARPDGPQDATVYLPMIPRGGSLEQPVDLWFPLRGAYRERNFECFTRFPFGFAERHEGVTVGREVIVYPSLESRPAFEDLLSAVTRAVTVNQPGGDEDFHRIRPYEPSDSARSVDWKATAHTGGLQVREFSREREQAVMIYVDLEVPPGEEAWFETAIECAAFLTFELAGRAIYTRFVTQGWDVTIPASANIYDVLTYLALVSPQTGEPRTVSDDKTYQIVLTCFPERFRALGWCGSAAQGRIVGPELGRL